MESCCEPTLVGAWRKESLSLISSTDDAKENSHSIAVGHYRCSNETLACAGGIDLGGHLARAIFAAGV